MTLYHTKGDRLRQRRDPAPAAKTRGQTVTSAVYKPYWMGLLAIPILCSISVWNGYPLVYEDTQAYLARPATVGEALGLPSIWADKAQARWLAGDSAYLTGAAQDKAGAPGTGRSIYYSAFIYMLSMIGGLWAAVFAQAAMLGTMVAVVWYRYAGLRSDAGFLVLLAGLAFGTSAGLFANLVMPDILSGLLVLALAILFAAWPRLERIDRRVLIAIAALAVVAHLSHLLIAAGLVVVAALLRFVARRVPHARVSLGSIGVGSALVICGIGASLVTGVALRMITGKAPVGLPHLTAHLVGQPVLADFVRDNCDTGGSRWAVCAYRDRLPIVWTSFLFSSDPITGGFAAADAEQRRALSDQDAPLLIAVFRSDPIATTAMMMRETGKQLVAFSYADLSPQTKAKFIDANFPPPVRDNIHESKLWSDDSAMWLGSRIQQVVVVLSLPVIALCIFAIIKRGRRNENNQLLFAAILISGVILNAFICGVLASPYDRFEARIIWLIPLLAVVLLISLYAQHHSSDVE